MKKSDEIKQLEMSLFEKTARQHPNFPKSYIPRPKREDTTANGLTRCIIDFITLHGGHAERISITGKANEIRNNCGRVVGVKWTKSHMTIGTADISATIGGRSVKIEVKIGTDRQSEAQKKYQQQIEQAGGLYYVARNFEDFVKCYNSLWKTK